MTPWISDGTPHQWTTPAGEVTEYPQGVSVTERAGHGRTRAHGAMTFYYTNQQSARLMFYHDHAYGITRLNVYAGEAAPLSCTTRSSRSRSTAAPSIRATGRRSTATEIPLVIQDKTFVPGADQLAPEDPTWDTAHWGGHGNLWFPHVYMPNQNPGDADRASTPWAAGTTARGSGRPCIGQTNGPVANPLYSPVDGPCGERPEPGHPEPDRSFPKSFMDTPLVNGTAYPYLKVQPQGLPVPDPERVQRPHPEPAALLRQVERGRPWTSTATRQLRRSGEVPDGGRGRRHADPAGHTGRPTVATAACRDPAAPARR